MSNGEMYSVVFTPKLFEVSNCDRSVRNAADLDEEKEADLDEEEAPDTDFQTFVDGLTFCDLKTVAVPEGFTENVPANADRLRWNLVRRWLENCG